MKSFNKIMFCFALLAVTCFILIGIAIAEKSLLGVLGAIIASILTMGLGFMTKKKLREKGKL